MEMTTDEQKRWMVVGIVMVKVIAPVLRDVVEQGMMPHYNHLDTILHPCKLNALTFADYKRNPSLKDLKFENINNNCQTHGKAKKKYNFNVSSEVDLAKLYLPDYLATFSAFDESLDLSAILRLLGYSKPGPIFQSPDPMLLIHTAADTVRDYVRNKWAHANLNEWTETFFNDCFTKFENLVKSVGIGGKEKSTLDLLHHWQTKGCEIVMGHAVDQELLNLVQQTLAHFRKEFEALQSDVAFIQDRQQTSEATLEYQQQRIDVVEAIQEEDAKKMEENYNSLAEMIKHWRDQQQALEATLEYHRHRIDEVEAIQAEDAEKMKENYNSLAEKIKNLEASPPKKQFDLESFRTKLADHYKRTAKVQTSVWSEKNKVCIDEVYTRLSMIKEECDAGCEVGCEGKHAVPATSQQLFHELKNGRETKRILVDGQAGIGKSTFVTKLTLDWIDSLEETNPLKKFKLVLLVKLREVSHCKTLEEVIRSSDLLPEEDEHVIPDLLDYITENQKEVLFVFDGYDEYGMRKDSDVFKIFKGRKFRNCCVLVTTRSSQGDDLREFADVQAEVTGFSLEDIEKYLIKQLGQEEAEALLHHLKKQRLIDTAKVPILCLFFSILWKKMREKLTTKNRTMIFLEIVQCILDYGNGKGASDQYRTVENSKDILADLGEVALEGLLSDDLLFEYSKLKQIKGCDVIIKGFLQITEDIENIRPSERVSFIHKTIQEFLAAWFVVHKLVPERRNLGRLQERASDSESCLRLESVFLFISGLSQDGAGADLVLRHLTDVKREDRDLQFMQTVVLPGKSEKTCYDLTNRQVRFHDLVFALFDEAQSKEGLLRHCLSSTDGVMVLSQRLVKNLMECNDDIINMDNVTVIVSVFSFIDLSFSLDENLRTFFDSFDVVVKVTEGSQAVQLGDFYRKFLNCGFLCECAFKAVLFSNKGSLMFYIIELRVDCELHERMFSGYTIDGHRFLDSIAKEVNDLNENHEVQRQRRIEHLMPLEFPFKGPSEPRSLLNAQNPSSDEYLLKHLQSLRLVISSSSEILRALGVIAGKSKYFNSVELHLGDGGDFCDFLEPAKELKDCSLWLFSNLSHPYTSAGVTRLSKLLPNFNNLSGLHLNMKGCTKDLVNQLVAVISHPTVSVLELKEVDLVEDAAIVLGGSVCRMSALGGLVINGKMNKLGLVGMQALFGGFSREIPLRELELSCFHVGSVGLELLRNSFQFFPHLTILRLVNLGIDSKDVCNLLSNVNSPDLYTLDLSQNPLGHGITSIVSHIVRFPGILHLGLEDVNCSEEDKKFIIENVRKVQPLFDFCPVSVDKMIDFLFAQEEARSDNH